MPKLIVTGDDHIPHEFPLSSGMTIGRAEGNHIQINEEKASRTHCRVRPEGKSFFLDDLNSSNGTRVNGEKISANHLLKHGDFVTIGKTTLAFEDENAPSAPPKIKLETAVPAGNFPVAEPVDEPAPEPEDGGLTVALSAVEVKKMDKKTLLVEKKKSVESADPGDAAPKAARPPARATPVPTYGNTLLVMGLLLAAMAVVVGVKLRQENDAKAKLAAVENNSAPAPVTVAEIVPPVADKGTTAKTPPKQSLPVVPPLPPEVIEKPVAKDPPPVVESDPKQAADADPKLAAELAKALAERERALDSGNYPAARAALQGFIAAHPGAPVLSQAKKELAETETRIEQSMARLLKLAEQAADGKKYRLATQRCTRLLASDANGKYGAQARQILNRLDQEAEPLFKKTDAEVKAELRSGNLDAAFERLNQGLDDFGGTKWGEQTSSDQTRVVLARSLLRQLDAECEKQAKAGKPIEARFSGGKFEGVVSRVPGLSLELKVNDAVVAVPLKSIDPAEFTALLKTLKLDGLHLELASLWRLIDRKEAAKAEFERALQDPEQAALALRSQGRSPDGADKVKNLRTFDFSKWQHQSEWEAASGSWSTQDGRLAQESAEGGDAVLLPNPAAPADKLCAKNARLSFEFELLKPAAGYVFVVEIGGGEKIVSATFTSDGLLLNGNLKARVSAKESWTPGPTRVDISISGDDMKITINGKAAKPFTVDGLADLTGTLTFRVRESACAIDNVILRNAE
jgi:pSer/pThr/pTyr-binding forkhead associated (FHA) protein